MTNAFDGFISRQDTVEERMNLECGLIEITQIKDKEKRNLNTATRNIEKI